MGRKVEGLKEAFKNITGKTVTGETIGEVCHNFNAQYKEVILTINVVDDQGVAIAAPVIVLKLGETAVNAEADGTYKVKTGTYSYDITKAGYEQTLGDIEVVHDDADAGAKTVTIPMATAL